MASTILLKKSSTSGSAPTTTDLQAGEIALNLADRKIYVEDGAGAIVTMGVYVAASAPANPVEGDLWYDTANDILKSHNGTAFAGVGDLSGLATVASTGSYNDLSNTPTIPTDNASLTNGAGYALASALPSSTTDLTEGTNLYFTTARAQGAFTGSTGVDITAGAISIGQDVGTTANVTFNNIIADGNLTVNGTVTAVNSTEVNIGDNTIVLNSLEVAAPTADAGFEVERGTSANVSFLWDETNDQFTVGTEKLKAGTLEGLVDGGSY